MKQQNIKKIALIRRNGFGDFICAVPLIKYLEQRYPEAEITLFVDQRNHALVPYFFSHHNIQVIPKGNKYLSLLKTAWKHRTKQFDLAISIKSSPMKLNNFFLALLGAKHRIAIVDDKSWHSKLINHPRLAHQYKEDHQALSCLRLFDPQIVSLEPTLYPKLKLKKRPFPLTVKAPYLFLSVSNNFRERTPSVERLASIANNLHKKLGFSVLISYQPQERAKAISLQQMLDMDSQLCDTPSLDDFLMLLDQADVVLAGDSGVCHFSASLNKKLVALYTQAQLKNWRPLSEQAICLQDICNVNNIPQQDIEDAVEHFLRLAHAQRAASQHFINPDKTQSKPALEGSMAADM